MMRRRRRTVGTTRVRGVTRLTVTLIVKGLSRSARAFSVYKNSVRINTAVAGTCSKQTRSTTFDHTI